MKPIIYMAAIGLTGAGAVVSFLNSEAHKDLVKKTYTLAKENDDLEAEIKAKKGLNLKKEMFADADLTSGSATAEDAIKLRFGRAMAGYLNWTSFLPKHERPADDQAHYEAEGLTFEPFNKTAQDKEGAQYKYITLGDKGIQDIKTGRALNTSAKKIIDGVDSRINSVLVGKIADLEREITDKQSDKKAVEAAIAEFKAAEKRIKELFKKEGLETLQDGKDKLVELEATRKERINEVDTLTVERDGFKDKLAANEKKIEGQEEYKAKRKVNLSVNEKKFHIASVNFDWGFAVINHDDKNKFFVNQKLMVLRHNRHVGDLTVSAVEPGRIICNIDYKSIRGAEKFRKGDHVVLSEPADR